MGLFFREEKSHCLQSPGRGHPAGLLLGMGCRLGASQLGPAAFPHLTDLLLLRQIWCLWRGWWRSLGSPRPTWRWRRWSRRWQVGSATPSPTETSWTWCWGSGRRSLSCEYLLPLLGSLEAVTVCEEVPGSGTWASPWPGGNSFLWLTGQDS